MSKKKGIQAGEVQHFLKNIHERVPEQYQNQKMKDRPDETWEIEHVYGYAGDRNKSCLSFGASNDEIVYVTAALGVVQTLSTHEQKFFGGIEKQKNQPKYIASFPAHQDDITNISIAHTEGRNIVATGECGAKSTIHIWDSSTMEPISQFSLGGTAKGVGALAISPCCRYIAVVDQSNDHNMSIFNINKKKAIVSVSAGTDAICDIQWSKKQNDLRFIAVTSRSLQFWNPADATKKLFKNGTFGQKYPQTKFNCCAFDEDGLAYSGGANGSVHCWDQRGELGIVLKAHQGDCTAVVCNQGNLISTGKDNKITIHSAQRGQFEFIRQIDCNVQHFASAIDVLDNKIVLGHDNGRIVTVNMDGTDQTLVNTTHCDGESWGLEIIQEAGTFLTCGDDNQFHEVSITEKRVVRSGSIWTAEQNNNGNPYTTNKIRCTASTISEYPAHQQGRAICYSRLHGHIAVSNNYGDITVFDYNNFQKIIAILKNPREWVEAMKYSPDNQYLAVGAHDDTIYVYKIDTNGNYSLNWKIEYMHSSAVTALDWSRDSRFLKAIDQAYLKLYYDCIENVHIKDGSSSLSDPSIWDTSSCKLGWEVMGVFPAGADGTDINSVDANADRTRIAAGDDFGTVCIFQFPCTKIQQDCCRISGHSEHVPRVRWYENPNDHNEVKLISCGGMDRTYIQWKKKAHFDCHNKQLVSDAAQIQQN